MNLILLSDKDCEKICGGNIADGTVFFSIISAIALLVITYKVYASSEGKAKVGNNYTFEWK